ncbi:hypothetical protein imdm_1423 [gamma proteobacterium IMCC2047]|nr:hypothetical protein imdm_1423 [gamma proteobacterium IMCC2047]
MQQSSEARVILNDKTTPHGIDAEPVDGERGQNVALELE